MNRIVNRDLQYRQIIEHDFKIQKSIRLSKGDDLVYLNELLVKNQFSNQPYKYLIDQQGLLEFIVDENHHYQLDQYQKRLQSMLMDDQLIQQNFDQLVDTVDDQMIVDNWLQTQNHIKRYNALIDLNHKNINSILKSYQDKISTIDPQQWQHEQSEFRQLVDRMYNIYVAKDCCVDDDGYKLDQKIDSLLNNGSISLQDEIQLNQQNYYCIYLCLGGQKKYNFKVQLIQCELEQYTKQKTKLDYYNSNQTGCINMIERNLQNKHVRPDGLDLHFGSFEKQIEQVLLNSKNKNYEVKVGDIIVTRHSNMGGISYLYNLVGTEQLDKQLFIKANQNMNRNLVIPLEMFWGEGKNVKEIGQQLMTVLRSVKTQLNEISYCFVQNHYLKIISLLVPKNELGFDKAKEVLNSIFE